MKYVTFPVHMFALMGVIFVVAGISDGLDSSNRIVLAGGFLLSMSIAAISTQLGPGVRQNTAPQQEVVLGTHHFGTPVDSVAHSTGGLSGGTFVFIRFL